MQLKDVERIIKPDWCLYWFMLFDKTFVALLLLLTISFALNTWPWVADKGDPLADFIAETQNFYLVTACTSLMTLSLIGYAGYVMFKFLRIKYILSETGISFGSGINYTEDLVAWQVINDVDLTRNILEQMTGVGTLWIATDNKAPMPMLCLRHFAKIREQLNAIIRNNYKNSRRVTKMG